MEQYIKKSALVAEIKKRKKELIELSNNFANQWACASLDNILSFIDTFEVKEVDLKKEIDDFMAKEWEGVEEEDEPLYSMIKNDLTDVAKHFFELGLKAKGE